MGKTRRDFCNEMNRVYDGHGVYIGKQVQNKR